jgi:hypothetical protein
MGTKLPPLKSKNEQGAEMRLVRFQAASPSAQLQFLQNRGRNLFNRLGR